MKATILYCLGVLALIGLLALGFIVTLHRLVDQAVEAERAARDAYWQGEIVKSNEENERALRKQAEKVTAIQAAADERIAAAERRQTELEKDNDALPDAACTGLARNRVQLLHR